MRRAVVFILVAGLLTGCFNSTQPPADSQGTIAPANSPTGEPAANENVTSPGPDASRVFRTLTFEYDGRTWTDAGGALTGTGSPGLPAISYGYNTDYRFWTTARILHVNATVTWEAQTELTKKLRIQFNGDGPNTLQAWGTSPLHVEWNVTDIDGEVLGLGVFAFTDIDGAVAGASVHHQQDFHVSGTLFVEEVKPLPEPSTLREAPLRFKGKTYTGVCLPVCETIDNGNARHPFEATSQPVELRGKLTRTGDRASCILGLGLPHEGYDPETGFRAPYVEGDESIEFVIDLRGYSPRTAFTFSAHCWEERDDAALPQTYVIEAVLTEAA